MRHGGPAGILQHSRWTHPCGRLHWELFKGDFLEFLEAAKVPDVASRDGFCIGCGGIETSAVRFTWTTWEVTAGALWGRRELLEAMPPFLAGGEMIREVHLRRSDFNEIPWKFEAGTPDVAAAVGLGVAADYLRELGMARVAAHEQELVAYALETLARDVPEIILYGPPAGLRGGVVPFNLPGVHAHDVAQILDRSGVCVRAGHHCTMPLHERLDLAATARAAFNVYSTKSDVDALVLGLHEVQRVFAEPA